jgi:spoIIIJ-associated protein
MYTGTSACLFLPVVKYDIAGQIIMESVEATGATVEDAIAAGMKELGVSSPSQVMVEVLEEPDKGIKGEGARDARVRLIFMGTRDDSPKTQIVSKPPENVTQIVTNPMYDRDETPSKDIVPLEQAAKDAKVGYEVLEELLNHMGFTAGVEIRRAASTRSGENTHWVLNVIGDDVNRLIGRRGDTLASLQYITRLIVSRHLQRRANIIVDAGGYKEKRSERLKGLAHRMADQAVRQGRVVRLEPMPPHERRIIHLTLRKRKDVSTESIGEGDKRKVTIRPKSKQ